MSHAPRQDPPTRWRARPSAALIAAASWACTPVPKPNGPLRAPPGLVARDAEDIELEHRGTQRNPVADALGFSADRPIGSSAKDVAALTTPKNPKKSCEGPPMCLPGVRSFHPIHRDERGMMLMVAEPDGPDGEPSGQTGLYVVEPKAWCECGGIHALPLPAGLDAIRTILGTRACDGAPQPPSDDCSTLLPGPTEVLVQTEGGYERLLVEGCDVRPLSTTDPLCGPAVELQRLDFEQVLAHYQSAHCRRSDDTHECFVDTSDPGSGTVLVSNLDETDNRALVLAEGETVHLAIWSLDPEVSEEITYLAERDASECAGRMHELPTPMPPADANPPSP